jgi:hypothetical protein
MSICVVFTHGHSSMQFFYFLNNVELKRFAILSILGIFLGENLSFREYAKILSLKISRKIGILSRLRHHFPHNILKTVSLSFVYPYFLYCTSIWASVFASIYQNNFFKIKHFGSFLILIVQLQ